MALTHFVDPRRVCHSLRQTTTPGSFRPPFGGPSRTFGGSEFPPTGGTHSVAAAVNDAGQVVGSSGINAYGPMFEEFTQAFLWESGAMRSLGALGCRSARERS